MAKTVVVVFYEKGPGELTGRVIRLVITSRHRIVRDAIRDCLSGRTEFLVVGETASIDALTKLCTLRRPDAVLVHDLELTVSKVEALQRVRAAAPGAQLVVTYAEVSPPALAVAAASGVNQLVPCSSGLEAVLRRVRECARPASRQQPDGLALTKHDVRVVSLLSSGRDVRDLADVLHVSPRTVENHKRRLYAKLGVRSASHAVSRAVSLGLIGPASTRQLPAEEDRTPLVVVHGPDRPGVDGVLRALVSAQLPVVRTGPAGDPAHEQWAGGRHDPMVMVLVDPTDNDWLEPAGLGARPIVVLSAEPDLRTSIDMLRRGARALLRAEDVATDLVPVLSVVSRGYLAVDAAQVKHLAGWADVRLTAGSSAVPVLTRREHDILSLLAKGRTIRQTAQALGIAAKTVENTQGHLFRKLGARNRAEAVTLAYRLGLLNLDS